MPASHRTPSVATREARCIQTQTLDRTIIEELLREAMERQELSF
jgi:hypothetical protein